ncbi:replication factor C large subunit [Candidatus Woesearchaeota archaeon]|nr:replication factor C large subunit [Candidatus Woesearchaeota archaeon]
MSLYTIKYAPQNEEQVFGQQLAVSQLKDYILNYKNQKKKAALLLGPLGVGKTASVYALAKQLKFDVLELNSSDLRNEAAMKQFLGSALGQQSLFFTPKLILIDEIDALSGVRDRGGVTGILKAITTSTFPVILTANDVTDAKFKPLLKEALTIEYHKLQYRTLAHALTWVAQQEKITVDEKSINSLARQADGDLRAALIDLHVCARNGSLSYEAVTTLSDRRRTQTILEVLTQIFKSSSVETALPALDDTDLEPGELMLWLDANIPIEYASATSIARAYEHMSRADVFAGRIRKRQHWRFLAYINHLCSAGVSSAKDERNTNFISYKPTMRLLRQWQINMKMAKRKEIAEKLAAATHMSKKEAFKQVPYLVPVFKKHHEALTKELGLSDEEGEWLEK